LVTTNADLVAQARLLEKSVPQGMSKLMGAFEEAFNGRRNLAIRVYASGSEAADRSVALARVTEFSPT